MSDTIGVQDEPVIKAIERLEIAPGDILVVRLPSMTSSHSLDRVHDVLKEALPDGVKTLVLGIDQPLTVLRPTEHPSHG